MSMCGAIAILLFTRILNEIVEWNGQVKCLTVERSHRFESFLCHFHWDFGNTHHDDIFLRQKKRYEKDTKILLNISLYCFQDSKMWLANKKSSWKKKTKRMNRMIYTFWTHQWIIPLPFCKSFIAHLFGLWYRFSFF